MTGRKLAFPLSQAVVDHRKGEELTHQYRERSNRNDISLLHHFFLNSRRPARLCAHDLPTAKQYPQLKEPFTDADYAPGGRLCTKVGLPCHQGRCIKLPWRICAIYWPILVT